MGRDGADSPRTVRPVAPGAPGLAPTRAWGRYERPIFGFSRSAELVPMASRDALRGVGVFAAVAGGLGGGGAVALAWALVGLWLISFQLYILFLS